MFQAVGELGQLINISSSNLIYHAADIGNVMDIHNNTKYRIKRNYFPNPDCVYEGVRILNMKFSTLTMGLFLAFVVIFLLSFLIRETLFAYFVKKEFTEAGWKKEAFFNTVMTCIWTIAGAFFLYYLYNVAEYDNAARNGQLVSYFSTH